MWSLEVIFVSFLCNFIIFSCGVSSTHYVPVYIFEDPQFADIVPSLRRLSQEEFRKNIENRRTSTVLVFAEKTLSPEDFALRDTDGKLIFSLISSLKSTHSTYWPLVSNPIGAVTELFNTNVVKTSIKELLDNPTFSIHNNDILIVDLKDAKDGEDRLEMLKRHDKDIVEVFRRYAKNNKNITAMLTSYSSSWVLSDEFRSVRKPREAENMPVVKANDNPKPQESNRTYSNKDLLIYVNSTASLFFKGNRVLLNEFELAPDNKKDAVSMNATLESKTNTDIKLMLNFKFGSGYWSLANISVTNATGNEYSFWIRDVYAPVGFSYHCHDQTFYNFSTSDVNLTLPGFQMQVYFNTTEGAFKKFGDAYDCVGFMSAPIWSGLFVTFIMALIMIFGLSMMMDIKTMDRFDDPKGKTITINASE